jgi:hypothetical protein
METKSLLKRLGTQMEFAQFRAWLLAKIAEAKANQDWQRADFLVRQLHNLD